MLRKRKIIELARADEVQKEKKAKDEYSVYDDVPDDLWSRDR
jgi:hypothetical protein